MHSSVSLHTNHHSSPPLRCTTRDTLPQYNPPNLRNDCHTSHNSSRPSEDSDNQLGSSTTPPNKNIPPQHTAFPHHTPHHTPHNGRDPSPTIRTNRCNWSVRSGKPNRTLRSNKHAPSHRCFHSYRNDWVRCLYPHTPHHKKSDPTDKHTPLRYNTAHRCTHSRNFRSDRCRFACLCIVLHIPSGSADSSLHKNLPRTHPTHHTPHHNYHNAHDPLVYRHRRPNIRSFPSHTHTHPQHKNGPPHRSSHNYRNGRRLFAYPRTFRRTRSARLGSSPHTQKPCRPHRLRKPFHTHHSSNDPSSDPHTSRRNPFALPRTHTLHSRSVFHPYKAFHTPHNALYSPAYQSKPRYIRFVRQDTSLHTHPPNTPNPQGRHCCKPHSANGLCACRYRPRHNRPCAETYRQEKDTSNFHFRSSSPPNSAFRTHHSARCCSSYQSKLRHIRPASRDKTAHRLLLRTLGLPNTPCCKPHSSPDPTACQSTSHHNCFARSGKHNHPRHSAFHPNNASHKHRSCCRHFVDPHTHHYIRPASPDKTTRTHRWRTLRHSYKPPHTPHNSPDPTGVGCKAYRTYPLLAGRKKHTPLRCRLLLVRTPRRTLRSESDLSADPHTHRCRSKGPAHKTPRIFRPNKPAPLHRASHTPHNSRCSPVYPRTFPRNQPIRSGKQADIGHWNSSAPSHKPFHTPHNSLDPSSNRRIPSHKPSALPRTAPDKRLRHKPHPPYKPSHTPHSSPDPQAGPHKHSRSL
jgi:hypothetical protein